MAGSRVQRVGTIYTRVTGLMRSGALKEDEKPLWFDVYEAFPPTYEPRSDRVAPPREIPNIFYAEDVIRAKFQEKYPNAQIDMLSDKLPLSERFIKKYQEIEREGKVDDVFSATEEALSLKTLPEAEAEPELRPKVKPKQPPKVKEPEPKLGFLVGSVFKTKKESS